ncbi:deoxyribonuclease-1 isoform X2 [Coregonus clupeaformis]|uniref:deoxyribonuclease-1 isoform X2 n=1 Tax=Coregonus clupeaformis TaxID=59861 RepID=UPI001E1C9D5E|nr:deoxyribonuclease-1 isoform X2 [Coregonus clupeaformis]
MKVASFNVRRLGTSKVADKNVLKYLIKIVSRYSVLLILEVVDRTGQAMTTFLRELNDTRANRKHPYTMVKSTRLGRDTYKEQFVFLYREDHVKLTDSYQYEDTQVGDEDAFAREPYILRFTCLNTVLKDLVLIPVHTKPEDSVKELDELYDVVKVVKRKWKTDNIMILGDFNADGSYVTKRGMTNIRIRSDKKFHWVIGDDVDTTANTGNDHTYDRIVMYGADMLEAMVPNSAKPFNYHKAFHLSEAMALSISDHYPVEVELMTAGTVPQKKEEKDIEEEEVESPSINPIPRKKKRLVRKFIGKSDQA